ncbi:MAG: ATP-binding protein [bacterium]|nr:ATP-binding protein [bacterium]
MNEYAKIAVLGLVAWHLYNDAVVRRRESIGKDAGPVLQIVFEEANKILTGASDGGDDDQGAVATSAQFQTMFRDGRKYRAFMHLIVQTVAGLPPGIMPSCNNAFFGQTKAPMDRDLMMAHLAFSEKGFTDEDYKRFLSRMPQAMAICKLGYSMDIAHTTPFLIRPAMVPGREPSDEELYDLMQQLKQVGWR